MGFSFTLTCGLLLAGCSWTSKEPAPLNRLVIDVADLELHLRDDSYRSFAHLTPDGRNVFEVTRWKLERLQRERPRDPSQWAADDAVLEFARARSLERLRLYQDAADAYRRVAGSVSRLAQPARQAAEVMERFAVESRPLPAQFATPEEELAAVDARIAVWQGIAQSESATSYGSLAHEETESWEVQRVELMARERSTGDAIEAARGLVQRHRESKLYPQHLLRLGDLHAEAARQEVQHARSERTAMPGPGYDRHLEAALSAYELASEARNTGLRREAQGRIQSLLSYHDGVRSHVY